MVGLPRPQFYFAFICSCFYFQSMLYPLVKLWVRSSLPFFAKRIRVINPEALNHPGPLLLACNHPNSFLDAMLMGCFMKYPVYFMTRGDVFKKAWVRKIFASLKMIPIYRIRDGKDKLSLNDETFIKSVEVLRNNGLLLIFVEGFCEHQTELQLPLKKGAPRILQSCWQEGIPAKVLPVWLEYSSFWSFGKTIDIRLGNLFGQEIAEDINAASCITKINAVSTAQLLHLSKDQAFKKHQTPEIIRWLLLLPAMLGAIFHAPLFLPINAFAKKVSKANVHFDSIMLAGLVFFYPLYLAVITLLLFSSTGQWWSFLTLLIFPLLAKAYLLWKK
jgi:1-acyl-sn-glycerol-3-phosphate acyltransferase